VVRAGKEKLLATGNPILVTGASGLIGRALVERLRSAGRSVLAVDRVPPVDEMDEPIAIAELTDASRLFALVASGVDGIIHCGGISGPMLGRDNPAGLVGVNVGGTVTLLDAARVLGVRRFVFCSSIVAYGDTPTGQDPVDEGAPLTSIDVYGASKAAADLLVRAYARQHGLDARVGRIGWVYGPRRRTPSALGRMLRSALDGVALTLDHDGSFPIQVVHVDDAVSGLLALYDADGIAGRAFNITAGMSIPVADVAALVVAAVPGADIRFTPGRVMEEARQATFSVEALRALGWAPTIGLRDGIGAYADWLSRHRF